MARIADVLAPQNEEGTKATILKWCKSAGESILKHEPLLELETDKVTVEVPSPASGELAQILAQTNEEVQPGQLIARIRLDAQEAAHTAGDEAARVGDAGGKPLHAAALAGTADGALAPTKSGAVVNTTGDAVAAATAAEDGRLLLSPAVRRLLSENALRADDIAGSGRNGRITAQDVARRLGAQATPARVAHTPIRRRVAEHMLRSLAQSPHVTTVFEIDLTQVQAHRSRHAAEYAHGGARLTRTAYFIAACARALAANPSINATYHADALELHADANIGIGTALGNEGLIVPVIHAAQQLELPDIALRLGQLVAAARAGKLAPQDVRGGTFTISNHGVSGSLLAAPIVIHQPQVAVLGVGKVERRVCVLESGGTEAIGIRARCYLTLTIDHRALDAFQANAFLAHVAATLERWGG